MNTRLIRRTRELPARILCVVLTLLLAIPPSAFAAPTGRENFKTEDLPSPVLTAPEGEVLTREPTFAWQAVEGATRYEFKLTDAEGRSVFRRDGLQATTFTLPGNAARLEWGREYAFRIRAYDHSSHRASPYSEQMRFTPVTEYSNQPPRAAFTASPSTGFAPLTVSFDASPSSDPDGDALVFEWDFDGDGTPEATGQTANNVFVLPGTYTVALTATDPRGARSTASETIEVRVAPPTVTAGVAPATIEPGGLAFLSWSAENAGWVTIEPELGLQPASGSLMVSPVDDTTYVVYAANESGEASATARLTVNAPPAASIEATPTSGSLPLTVEFSTAGSIDPDGSIASAAWDFESDGSIDATGIHVSQTYEYQGDYVARVVVTDNEGASAEATKSISVLPPKPAIVFQATPSRLFAGESALLTWSVKGADQIAIDNGIGPVDAEGATSVAPATDTTYTLTATGPGGTSTASARITPVPVQRPVAGSFGSHYDDLIPTDASLDQYDPERFAIVTGEIGDGVNPVAGVQVSVKDHPEYGTTLTDSQGRYALPVEGGGAYVLLFDTHGFLPVDRSVTVPPAQALAVDPVILTRLDDRATHVEFNGDRNTTIVHTSSVTETSAGARACTLVFQGDNSAWAVGSGPEVPLSEITVRASEYTTPAAMPAELPPASAFTYCVELTVDEAEEVRFDKPVAIYVDNFLGFPVGSVVPVGYYDREIAKWVPSDNGVVVEMLDVSGDGDVDALDVSGDGEPDDLDNDGSYADEARGLAGGRFQPGGTAWRAEMTHFTPTDLNSPAWVSGDTDRPEGEVSDSYCDSTRATNSYVSQHKRVFHEDIPVAGTGVSLHYSSEGVEGHQAFVEVRASGDSVSDSLERILVSLNVGGRTITETVAPEPNQVVQIPWDGLDWRGDPMEGEVRGFVGIKYEYAARYVVASYTAKEAAQLGLRFFGWAARPEAANTAPVETLKRFAYTQSLPVTIRRPEHNNQIAPGWTLSNVHAVDPQAPDVLRKGDGSLLYDTTRVVRTSADQATAGSANFVPRQVALAPDGAVWTVAYKSYSGSYFELFRIDPFTGASTWPVTYKYDRPTNVSVAPNGDVYMVCYDRGRVYQIAAAGTRTWKHIAGSGAAGPIVEGVPATSARVAPRQVAADLSGNVYLAEDHSTFGLIRVVSPDGRITILAGNGSLSPAEGCRARDLKLGPVSDVECDDEGNVYFTSNSRVWRIDTNGIIRLVAGNGTSAHGDFSAYNGRRAVEVPLRPTGLAFDSHRNLYVSTRTSSGVDQMVAVDTDGIVTVVAFKATWTGDGPQNVPASRYCTTAGSFDVDPFGSLLFNGSKGTLQKVSLTHQYTHYLDRTEHVVRDGERAYVVGLDGRHIATRDRKTGKTLQANRYDERGRLESVTDYLGNQLSVRRDPDGSTLIHSPDGDVTKLVLDGTGKVSAVKYADDSQYRFSYTDSGLMTEEIDPRGSKFAHKFDETGRVTEVSDPEGAKWRFSREQQSDGTLLSRTTSAEGNATTLVQEKGRSGGSATYTSPSGATVTNRASADGLSSSTSLADGTTVTSGRGWDPVFNDTFAGSSTTRLPSGLTKAETRARSYPDLDPSGSYSQVVDAVAINGKTATRTENILDGTVSFRAPSGRTSSMRYDTETLLPIETSVPGFASAHYTHDSRGRLTSASIGERTTSYSYDASGNVEAVTGPDGKTARFAYDALGRVLAQLRPDDTRVDYSYDSLGNLTRLVTPSGQPHAFTHTSKGAATSYTTPLEATYRYAYDLERNLRSVTAPSGSTIEFGYSQGVLTSTNFPGGEIAYGRDSAGRLTSITRGSERSTFTYDGPLPKTEVRSGAATDTLAWTYNADLVPSSFTYAGATQTYGYDADGLVTSASPFAIARDAASGLPTSVTAGGFALTRDFNAYGEIDAAAYAQGAASFAYELTRDTAGRITGKTERSAEGTHTWTYAYDTLGRLTRTSRDGALAEAYAYDANGNRTAMRAPLRGIEETVALTFGADDRVLQAGENTYTLTEDGFLAAKHSEEGTTTYAYSALGELTRVDLPDGREVAYTYDASGRRVAKSVDGETTARYEWTDATHLLAIYDAEGECTARFTYADGRVPLSVETTSGTYHLSYDQVGSLRAVLSADGHVAREIAYDSFGCVITDTNPALAIGLGFAGGLADTDTGLTLFGARDFDPALGRWCAKDPIGFSGGDANLYGYCLGDPVGLVDPLGLELRVYSSDAVGVPGANHAFVYSTELETGRGMNGSSSLTFDGKNGIGSLDAPYRTVELPEDVSEQEAMDRINSYEGWNDGIWCPWGGIPGWLNDCHDQLEEAFTCAGLEYPGAPGGRMDYDDWVRDWLINTTFWLANPNKFS